MKKLISLLLLVSNLAMAAGTATTVPADYIDGSSVSRNYAKNGNFTLNANGYVRFNNTAALRPTTGTGGTPTITFARTTSSPLAGDGSGLLTKTAVNLQGDGVSYDFKIDRADQTKILNGQFDYEIPSGTYASSDLLVAVYDKTNAKMMPVFTGEFIQGATTASTHYFQFQASPNSVDYRFIVYVSSTSASAYTFKLDSLKIGGAPPAPRGSLVTDPVSYTPSFNGFGSPSAINITSHRNGKFLVINGTFTAGTTTAVEARVNLGFNGVDGGLLVDSIPAIRTAGVWFTSATAASHGGSLQIEPATGYITFGSQQGFSAATVNAVQKQLANGIISNGEIIHLVNVQIPIAGWGTGQVSSADDGGRPVFFSAALSTSSVAVSTPTQMAFTTRRDTVNGGTSPNYLVPSPGYYKIRFNASGPTSVIANTFTYIYKNGSSVKSTQLASSANTQYIQNAVEYSDNFIAGDTISFYTAVGSGTWSFAATEISIERMPDNRQIVYQGVVSSGATATIERVERAVVNGGSIGTPCTASPCTVTQPWAWISSITRSGTGAYTATFSSGIFSAAPNCIVNTASNLAQTIALSGSSATSQSVNFYTVPTAAQDATFNIICMGPR